MPTKYSVKITNHSLTNGKMCLFQKLPDQPSNLFSLAWLTKLCCKGCNVMFKWKTDYCATWAETGVLRPGVTFEAGGSMMVDPSNTTENSLGFTYVDGSFAFEDTGKTTPAGNIGIYPTDKIPNNNASIGVGMNGEAAFAVQALMNNNFIFIPKVKYYLIFGGYSMGTVMDLSVSTDAFELKFPLNEFDRDVKLEVELREDNRFTYIK